jgi:molybdopterin molybdotransferase
MSGSTVLILDALGRVLIEDISVPRDIPHEDNSAMDGFALNYHDSAFLSGQTPHHFKVIGESRAGKPFGGRIGAGEAVRIMTGALIPEGANTVVMSEYTSVENGTVRIHELPSEGAHVRKRGEYLRIGDTVLRKGNAIGPAEIGILATMGLEKVRVYGKPVVAVLSTGDELVEIGNPLGRGQVYCSNAYSISAQILECGATPVPIGIAPDDEQQLIAKLRTAMSADVIVTSGGVSKGRHDLVRQALNGIGMELVFWNVGMKPGKPMLFGMVGKKPIFGLPGNPGATMICFEQFVRPALLNMMGHTSIFRPQVDAVLTGQSIVRSDRIAFAGCRLGNSGGNFTARPIPKLRVGVTRSVDPTDAFIMIRPGTTTINPGEIVPVQVLRWPSE